MNRNFIYILVGFIFGQGSMFLVQTYLVTQGLFELIANIGIALGLLSLIQWTTDGGGVFFLSKYEQENTLDQNLGGFIQARFVIGFVFVCILIVPLYIFDLVNNDIFHIFIFSPLVVLIWAFNLTGVADSRNKNKFLGPLSGLSWLFSAVLMLLFYDNDNLSYMVGLGYCIGLFVTVLFQIKVLDIRFKNLLKFGGVSSCFVKLKIILGYSAAYISAQGYARTIPILISYYLDSVSAGMYIYAKNFTNSISQLILFSRRVEFTRLVTVLNNGFEFKKVYLAQKFSLIIAIVITFFVAIFYFLTLKLDFFYGYERVAIFALFMAALQVLWVFSSSLGQVLVVKNKTRQYSYVVFSTCLASITLMYFSIEKLDVFSVFIAEALMYLTQIYIYFTLIKKNAR